MAILKAILAHLYIAWIHPFGDGNGRTARLLEVQILLGSGVPAPAAQLMSNHYNQTRSEYYRQLGLASKTGSAEGFIRYAVEGLRDNLVEQIGRVRSLQWDIAWQNYLHEVLSGGSPVAERRKSLLIALSRQPAPVAHDALLNTLPGEVVQRYARKTPENPDAGPRCAHEGQPDSSRAEWLHRQSRADPGVPAVSGPPRTGRRVEFTPALEHAAFDCRHSCARFYHQNRRASFHRPTDRRAHAAARVAARARAGRRELPRAEEADDRA